MLRTLVLAAALLPVATPAHAQDMRVGFVNLDRVEQESVQGKKIIEALKQEFAPREQKIIEFQARIKEARDRFEAAQGTLSDSERAERWKSIANMMKKSDRMMYALQEDARLRRRQITGDYVRDRNAAIEAVIKAGNFDLVLQKAVFSSDRVDITDKVLAEMARRAGGGAP